MIPYVILRLNGYAEYCACDIDNLLNEVVDYIADYIRGYCEDIYEILPNTTYHDFCEFYCMNEEADTYDYVFTVHYFHDGEWHYLDVEEHADLFMDRVRA